MTVNGSPIGQASLGHQGADLRLRQVRADGALGQHPAVQEQPALPPTHPAAGHPAHHEHPGVLGVQVVQQVVGRERERVADHQAYAGPARPELVAAVGTPTGRPHEPHRERLDRPQLGRQPQRNGRLGLHLTGPASDRLRHAADERDRAGLLGDRRQQGLRRVIKMGGGEQHPERGRAVPQRRTGHPRGPPSRLGGIRGQHQGCASLHESRLCADPPAPGLAGRLAAKASSTRLTNTSIAAISSVA